MSDPPPDGGADTGVAPDHEPTAGTPRWVKVFGIITAVVLLLLLILLLTGRGHGPDRHTGSAGGGQPPSTTAITGHAALADCSGSATSPQGDRG